MIIGQDSDNKTYEPKLDICGTVSAVNMPAVQGNEASKTNLVALDVTGNEVKKNAQRTRWSLCAFNDNGQPAHKKRSLRLTYGSKYGMLSFASELEINRERCPSGLRSRS